MLKEVKSAADFLTSLLKAAHVKESQTDIFNDSLQAELCRHYKDHWFPDKPCKGSGFRCIRINHKLDPILEQVIHKSAISDSDINTMFPKELTIWVDPLEVSYRIGENGSIGILYTGSVPTSKHNGQSSSSNDIDLPLFSCKDQLMNSLPNMSRDMTQLTAFAYS